MRLAPRIFLPVGITLVGVAVVVFGFGFVFLASLQERFLLRAAQGHETAVHMLMLRAMGEAQQLTALFVRLPEVEAAYRLALAGNIDDEADPKIQEARQMLRRALAPMLAGYEAVMGSKLKLHFHLPNSRSFVRLWRKTNFSRGGQDLDISDDISAFRQTVVQVNRSRQPQKGLEVGVGGFDLRSVIPVTAADGTPLGSAEVLVEFGEILESAARQLQLDLAVFMDASLLPIALQLQDPAKHPRVGSFVQVRAPKQPETAALLDPTWLEDGRRGRTIRSQGAYAVAAIPLEDFSGKGVGVLVFGQSNAELAALLQNLWKVGTVALGVALVVIFVVIYLTVRRVVLRPLERLTEAALAIRDGNFNIQI